MSQRVLNLDEQRDVAEYLHHFLPPKPWYQQDTRHRVFRGSPYRRLKRLMDVIISLMVLPFVLPLLMLCGLCIKLDSRGPIFFVQKRTGQDGCRFSMYKLRTMVANAEELKDRYLSLNELRYPDFKLRHDPRVTVIGRVLRRTSLDELPQLFNVLRGDMSLVGPRPTSFSASMYNLWHTMRLEAKPGITGLWQISGRSELNFDERLRLDIAYLQNQSLWLDVCILLRTVGCIFGARGAY